MQETTNILQRMREIAVQAANETNTVSDRESLNQEFTQIRDELDRIANSTTFNGQNVLDGSRGTAQFQVGANSSTDNQIRVDLSTSTRSEDIGKRFTGNLNLTNVTGTDISAAQSATTVGDGNLNITTADGSAALNLSSYAESVPSAKGRIQSSAYAIAESINNNSDINVDAEAFNTVTGAGATLSSLSAATSNSASQGDTVMASASYTLNINGVDITTGYVAMDTATAAAGGGTMQSISATANLTADPIVAAINEKSDETDVTAQVVNDNGVSKIQLKSLNGGNIAVSEMVTNTSGYGSTGLVLSSTNGTSFTSFRGSVEIGADNGITVDATTNGDVFTNLNGSATGTLQFNQAEYLDTTDVLSVDNARTAIDRIDSAIEQIDSFRGELGAAQNRFESTITNLNNSVQNLTASRSRIQDADIATQASELTQNNIRRQAAASVLAQANQQQQIALQLLGGG
jgi:flagellin